MDAIVRGLDGVALDTAPHMKLLFHSLILGPESTVEEARRHCVEAPDAVLTAQHLRVWLQHFGLDVDAAGTAEQIMRDEFAPRRDLAAAPAADDAAAGAGAAAGAAVEGTTSPLPELKAKAAVPCHVFAEWGSRQLLRVPRRYHPGSSSPKDKHMLLQVNAVRTAWEQARKDRHGRMSDWLAPLPMSRMEVRAVLGSGSNGELLQVAVPRERHGENVFAMKKMWGYFMAGEDEGAAPTGHAWAFLREFEVSRQLPHPFLCHVYLHKQAEVVHQSELERELGGARTWYVVMEWVLQDLQQYVEEVEELSDGELLRFAVQILTGVHHLNSHGVVHRDLKLNNVMLTKAKEVRLIDFGCCTTDMGCATMEGNIANRAPELLSRVDGAPIDWSKNDVWAVGCMLYEMAAGRHPLETPARLFVRDLEPEPLPSDTYPQLSMLVAKLLQRDPARRPNAREALDLAESLLFSWCSPLPPAAAGEAEGADDMSAEEAEAEHCTQELAVLYGSMEDDGRFDMLGNPDFLYFDSVEEMLKTSCVVSRVLRGAFRALAAERLAQLRDPVD